MELSNIPWWGWAAGLWIGFIALYLARDSLNKKQIEKEVKVAMKEAKKSKGSKKVAAVEREVKTARKEAKDAKEAAAAASAKAKFEAASGGGASPLLRPEENKSDAVFMRQGDLPLPPGQNEFRLVRALDGDKIKCEILIAQELQRVPHQTREDAALAVLIVLRGTKTFSPRAA